MKLSDVYLIVRKPEHRHGKGRFWKEGSRGYTDDVMEAGVFTAQEAKDNTEEPSYARAIPLREILADISDSSAFYPRCTECNESEYHLPSCGKRTTTCFEVMPDDCVVDED